MSRKRNKKKRHVRSGCTFFNNGQPNIGQIVLNKKKKRNKRNRKKKLIRHLYAVRFSTIGLRKVIDDTCVCN